MVEKALLCKINRFFIKTLTKNKERANIRVADKGSVLFDNKIVLNLKQVLRVYCLTVAFRTLIFGYKSKI